MRFVLSLVLAAVAVPVVALAVSAPVPTLSLAQALDAVEKTNPDVLLGRETVAQALELTRQQRAGVLPNLAVSAQQRRAETVSITGTTPVQTPAGNRFDARLTGSYSVLNPSQLSAVNSARAGEEVARFGYQATVQSVLARVAAGYFAHLRNLQRNTVLEANMARARALLTLARNQVGAGVATQIDVTRAEAQVALAEQARLQQDTVIYQSAMFLTQLLDLPADQPLVLENFVVRQVSAPVPGVADEAAVKTRRPDFLSSARAVEQTKIDVRTARYEQLPTLSLSADYGYVAAGFDARDTKQAWSAGAGVSLPVFDGLRSSADRRAALSSQRSAEQRLRRLDLQISAEIRLAAQDATSRHAQIAVAETGQRLAEEELGLAQQRYEQGVADNREVIEAQTRLALAGDNLVEAVYQYNLSRVELARVKGDVRSILAEKAE